MVCLFLLKHHVDIWVISLPIIWVTTKTYVANYVVFMDGQTCCYVPLELVRMMWNYFCLCHIVEVCIPQAFGVNTQTQFYQMEVAYNNVFRRFFGYDRFSSASQMFIENRVDNFGAHMRRLIYGFRERLYVSENCLVIRLINSAAWSKFRIVSKLGKRLYVQSCAE